MKTHGITLSIFLLTAFHLIGQNENTVSGKYDFVAGEKIIFFDDFGAEPVGEFPAKWNSNIGGDIVTATANNGKWLRMKAQGGNYIPELDLKFPENVTIEFDVFTTDDVDFKTTFYSEEQYDLNAYGVPGEAGSEVTFTNGTVEFSSYSTDESNSGKEILSSNEQFLIPVNRLTHVAIWIQKSRYRLYLATNKVFDIPKGVFQNYVYNRFRFETSNSPSDVLISNFKIAVGTPDTRNQLTTTGRFSTTGILFDVNSDKIKPESHACIKEIAQILKENSGIKIKVVGHTDSDGDAAKNIELSKRRAESVKKYLGSVFGVDTTMITTDGKGESEPLSDNKTPEGKAQNRRVEFIKE